MAFQISKEKVEQLDVKGCLIEGWNTLKGDPVNVFLAFIFVVIGSLVTLGVLMGALFAGFTSYILKLRAKDESAKPTDVFSKLNVLLPALLVVIVCFALGIANNLIIGGIFGNIISLLTGVLVSSVTITLITISIPLLGNGSITGAQEAIQTGWETYLLSPKTFFLIAVVAHILSFVGLLFFGIGILVTAPIGACMMVVVFEKLTKEELGSSTEAH